MNWLVLDRQGVGVLVASALLGSESEELLTICLEKMFQIEPDAMLGFTLHISDGNLAFRNAWRSAIQTEPQFVFCR